MHGIAGDFDEPPAASACEQHLPLACRTRAACDLGGGGKAQELVEIRRARRNGLPQQQRGRSKRASAAMLAASSAPSRNPHSTPGTGNSLRMNVHAAAASSRQRAHVASPWSPALSPVPTGRRDDATTGGRERARLERDHPPRLVHLLERGRHVQDREASGNAGGGVHITTASAPRDASTNRPRRRALSRISAGYLGGDEVHSDPSVANVSPLISSSST